MVSLIFIGNPIFEPLVIFDHLCSQIASHSTITDYLEVKRFTEKITALVGKLEIDSLIEKFEQLYESLKESKSKDKILKAICEEIKGRKIAKEKKKEFMAKVVEKEKLPIYSRMMNLM